MVHGNARAISAETGVGKAESEGRSRTSNAAPEIEYCSKGPPVSPYSSRSDWRIMAIASGEVLPNEVTAAIDCSTGSIGVMCVMT